MSTERDVKLVASLDADIARHEARANAVRAERRRVVLRLSDVLTYEEMAQQLGRSTSWVHKELRRARTEDR